MSDYMNYKRSYQDFKDTINLTVGHDVGDELENFCLGAVFRTWGSNDMLYSPAYREILAQIFEKDYSEPEILKNMKTCSERGRKIAVPAFFKEMVAADKVRKTDNAANTLGALYEFLALIALLNGDFTMEEASTVNEVINVLKHYAQENGAPVLGPIPEFPKAVTGKNDSYQVTPLMENNGMFKMPSELTLGDDEQGIFPDFKRKGIDDLLDFLGKEGKDVFPSSSSVNGNTTQNPNGDAKTAAATGPAKPQAAVAEEPLPERSEEEFNRLMEELNGLVGLVKVKEDIRTLLNFIKINKLREERGMKVPKMSYHLVFTGNPGTGKTTVARLVAQLYYQMGLLPKGQLIETDRSSLVAGYLGQTAIKTQEVISRALGGVLFIDEAYSLANDEQDTYGKEAIETLLKAMEDHRDELVVIVAGYTELMHKFINSNPGLNSRFNKYFLFPDYTGPELKGIFDVYCKKNGYRIDEETAKELEKRFSAMYEERGENFGNGRDVRNIFEKAINHQANRLAEKKDVSDDDLQMITMEDLEKAMEKDEARPKTESEKNVLEEMLKSLKESTETDETES